jgi:tRNA-dihydrouridine synthase 1
LDQIKEIKEALPHITIIANGNVTCLEDCEDNLQTTNADGIMSAEGLLDDPALFVRKTKELNRNSEEGEEGEKKGKKEIRSDDMNVKKKNRKEESTSAKFEGKSCPDKLHLGLEYLELVDRFPVKMKSVIFHIRRICREDFTKYQLMEDCVSCKSSEELKCVITEAIKYKETNSFVYDKDKEKKAKENQEKRKREEGKRKLFEERMVRKAKREKKTDLHFYLSQGSENPTIEKLEELKKLPKELCFEIWKSKHSQHCYNYHFEAGGCHRDRTCSFLHHDPSFIEENVVAYG